jgi:ArsR family transcriptional regulator, arsenate/arsenite/antimonite-responsive transcriptional repressor
MSTRIPVKSLRVAGRAAPKATRDAIEGELARLAKALGHPARVAIVRMLAESGECQCGSISDRIPLAQSTVSQHLKVLKQAGLIRGELDPPRICYCIDPVVLDRLKTLVARL